MLTLDFSGILGKPQAPAASSQRKSKETLLQQVQRGGEPCALLLMALEYIGDITHDEAYKERAQEAVRQLVGKQKLPTPAISPYLRLKTVNSCLGEHWQAAFDEYSLPKYRQQSSITAACKELKEYIAAAQWAAHQTHEKQSEKH